MIAANLEKSLPKRQKDVLDEIPHLVEHCENGFTFEALDIAQCYLECWLTLKADLRVGRGGEELSIFVHCFEGVNLWGVTSRVIMLAVTVTDDENVSLGASHSRYHHPLGNENWIGPAVFVVSVKLMDGP